MSSFRAADGSLLRLPLSMKTTMMHILPGLKCVLSGVGTILSEKIPTKSAISDGIFSSSAERAAQKFNKYAEKYNVLDSMRTIVTPEFVDTSLLNSESNASSGDSGSDGPGGEENGGRGKTTKKEKTNQPEPNEGCGNG
jgi:hypothetical protein